MKERPSYSMAPKFEQFSGGEQPKQWWAVINGDQAKLYPEKPENNALACLCTVLVEKSALELAREEIRRLKSYNRFALHNEDLRVMGLSVSQILKLKCFYEMETGKKPEDI